MSGTTLRLAVARTTVPADPGDAPALRAAGAQVRELMREAAGAGARLVQFPEGALVYPGKRLMSSAGPERLAEADWSRADWGLLRAEAEAVAALAGELRLWTVLGSVHPLTAPARPHNSLYVISDRGELVTRYDKRLLSHAELSYLYTPGTAPVVFEVDGFRFGAALCIEVNFPELFAEYERLGVDCVLLSAMAEDVMFGVLAQAYGTLYNYWLGYSTPAQYGATAPAGVVAPGGRWLARCPAGTSPALALADLDRDSPDQDIEIALRYARPWRRTARAGNHPAHLPLGDRRSADRTCF
ncbi:carbon-nitrogen hydrolase family protein [Kitasatospora sp. NPDC002227]|uniref:carbon-nitrogen hydrolase family protein n=1 Tax=Kitasatospora sp. NPDC002227 TaxID=3154773 RepID=UPI00332A84EA